MKFDKIIDRLRKFRDERNWSQFHTPENLAKSVSIEANELLENYQWGNDNVDIDNVKEELADVMGYCILLCDKYDFDIEEIMLEKIEKNEKKYPKELAYGKSTKYNKL